jgi:hypothetical protein
VGNRLPKSEIDLVGVLTRAKRFALLKKIFSRKSPPGSLGR